MNIRNGIKLEQRIRSQIYYFFNHTGGSHFQERPVLHRKNTTIRMTSFHITFTDLGLFLVIYFIITFNQTDDRLSYYF